MERRFIRPVLHFKIQYLLLAILLLFFAFFYAHKIFFVGSDLGRHIKNGQVFLARGFPITTNYYSYTQPDFPAINHHWGTGVVFYFIWRWFGFAGLSILNMALYLFAFLFFFKAAQKQSNFSYAFFFSVLAIPLIAWRTEIRPEGFSFLLMGLFYYLLYLFREDKITFRRLLILLALQVLWVNLHIFFIIGPLLIGLFWLHSLLNPSYRKLTRPYAFLTVVALVVCLINPFGFRGLLEPLMILREYGYMIAENQSLFFMRSRFPDNPVYPHFLVLFFAAIVSFIPLLVKKERKVFIVSLLLILFFGALAFNAVRMISVFSCFFIAAISANIYTLLKDFSEKFRQRAEFTALIISLAAILVFSFSPQRPYSPFRRLSGLGLYPRVNLSAEFFKYNNIQGPIFNNYDIGSYLIFHLFPKHRVFVDNRPEAYSVSFFKEIYEPMQADEAIWGKMDARYNFNCIYFYRRDITPHAQPFLIRRLDDPAWAAVFVDNYNIILLKRNKQNAGLIKRYELPKSIFRVSR